MNKEKALNIISLIIYYLSIGVLFFYLASPLFFQHESIYEGYEVRKYFNILLVVLLTIKLAITRFKRIEKINLLNSLFLVISGILTFFLINYLNIYSILAVTLVSLTGGIYLKEYGALITIGAFLGSSVNMDIYSLLLSLLIACVISESLKNTFIGVGGKLGTISFISVFLSYHILNNSFAIGLFYNLKEIAIILLIVVVSAVLTFFVNNKLNMGPIISYSIVSLIGVILFYYIFKTPLDLVPIIYGASFIGMTKMNVNKDYFMIIVASFIFSLILYVNVLYKGPGGLFGTTSLISVLIAKLIFDEREKRDLT